MPSSLTALSSSSVRIWPSASRPGFCSSGPNQPLSPREAQRQYVSTPCAEYFASVPPIPMDSSSGWAKDNQQLMYHDDHSCDACLQTR